MAIDKKKLVEALKEAKTKAQETANNWDQGGSCNFDTCMIRLPRMQQRSAEKIADEAGVRLDRWTSKGAGVYAVGGWTYGQGNSQTKSAEKASQVLREHGFETFVHYAMD